MNNRTSGLILSAIFSAIVSAFTPEANLTEDMILFCLFFIAYCKFIEKD